MPKSHFGANRLQVFTWLTESWIKDGPPVCFVEGFPGVGKSTLVEELLMHVQKLAGWQATIDEVTERASPSVLDTFFDLSGSLSRQGLSEMEAVLLNAGDPNLAFALEKVLRRPVLIVLDEAQRLFSPDSGQPLPELAGVLSFLRTRPALQGRLLLMSDRLVERARWSESFPIQTLTALSDHEAEQLLDDRLRAAGISDAVSVDRKQDLIRALGCNPRAMETLVATLTCESLDEIMGRNPGLWAIEDREVSREFLEKLERELLERTMAHLEPLQYRRLLMLAAHRKSFESEALEQICGGTRKEWRTFRNVLVTRFLLNQRLGWHSLHPIVREIGLAHLKENAADFKQAHSKSADYHLRHFRARMMVVGGTKLAASFAELRYHLFYAERQNDLRDVVLRLTDYLKTEIKSTAPVPTDSEELDQRIAVLSVLLEDGGAKGLEYHLAKCLRRRGKPSDVVQAAIHAKSATGAGAPAAAWVLRAQLEEQLDRGDDAVETIYAAITSIAEHDNHSSLYQYGAELLSRKGNVDDALLLLRKGIVRVPPEKNVTQLYQFCAELLAREGRVGEAIDLLRESIGRVLPQFNLVLSYQYCAELMAREGRVGEAIELLREGIGKVPPQFNLFMLYQFCAELLTRKGRAGKAIELLREGIGKVPPEFNQHKLIENLIYLGASSRSTELLKDVAAGKLAGPTDASQVALAICLLHQINGEWEAAALAAHEGRLLRASYVALRAAEAYSWLSANRADKAKDALDSFVTMDYTSGGINTWLACLVALRMRDEASARSFYATYLGKNETVCSVPTEQNLLQIWNSPVPLSTPHPAYYFSTLPASLTGLDHAVTRPPTLEVCVEITIRIGAMSPANSSPQPLAPTGVAPSPAVGDARSGLSILVLATEWKSRHGGLSTLNRELCCALAKGECSVICVVPVIDPAEVEQARKAGVNLIAAPAERGADAISGLYRRLRLPEGFAPNVVIGHGRITGPAASAQVRDSFPSAKRLHFIHMAPGEIEWFKGKVDAAATAEERERLERDLAQGAALVVAVGPRLHREVGNLLEALDHPPPIHQLDPGFASTPERAPPPALHCLILGRAEDLRLKGLDIGALGIAQVVSGNTRFNSPPELIVRGAPQGTGAKLRTELLALPGIGNLSIRVREYTDNEDEIDGDLKRASLLFMPSRREGFGLVALEALEMGTPILVSDTSGIGEFLRGVLGDLQAQHHVVETVDDLFKAAAEWAKHIEIVLRDREAAFARAKKLADTLADSHSWASAIASLLTEIKRIV